MKQWVLLGFLAFFVGVVLIAVVVGYHRGEGTKKNRKNLVRANAELFCVVSFTPNEWIQAVMNEYPHKFQEAKAHAAYKGSKATPVFGGFTPPTGVITIEVWG